MEQVHFSHTFSNLTLKITLQKRWAGISPTSRENQVNELGTESQSSQPIFIIQLLKHRT